MWWVGWRWVRVQVPSVAIENVYFKDNTSVMQEEVLAHRLGLVPLLVDAHRLEAKAEGEPATAANTLVFKFEAVAADTGVTNVLSSSIVWVPHGDQATRFADCPPRPVDSDILLLKLKPGQRVSAELWATKGVGMEHAKWSPVATATYRLLPLITLPHGVRLEPARVVAGAACLGPCGWGGAAGAVRLG